MKGRYGRKTLFSSTACPTCRAPRRPGLRIGAAAATALLLVVLFAGCSPSQEYDLVYPDLMTYLGKENCSVLLDLTTVKFGDGSECNMYELYVHSSRLDQVHNYLELLEQSHFELAEERDGFYFFRFTGSNAPKPLSSKDTDYHVMIALVEDHHGYELVRCSWMKDFYRDTSSSVALCNPANQTEQPQETKPAETTAAQTSPPPETEPKSDNDLVIQDPCKFFGCRTGENHLSTTGPLLEGDAWIVSCMFDMDAGKEGLAELIKLYCDEYSLQLIRSARANYISTSAQQFYHYYFTYTGSNSLVDGFRYKDDKEFVETDICLSIQHNYSGGWIRVTLRMDPDLILEDEGYRASRLPTDYTGNSDDELASVSNPDWKKNVLRCTDCEGDGDCSKCNDFGYLWSSASDSHNRNCYRCNNSGVCQTCFGSGLR